MYITPYMLINIEISISYKNDYKIIINTYIWKLRIFKFFFVYNKEKILITAYFSSTF